MTPRSLYRLFRRRLHRRLVTSMRKEYQPRIYVDRPPMRDTRMWSRESIDATDRKTSRL